MQSSEAISVEATPIEAEIAPQSSIERQLSELAASASELAAQYRPHEIADAADYKASKKARADANKDVRALRERARQMTARVDSWSRGVKEAAARAMAPFDGMDAEYKGHIADFEASVVEARKDMMRERYEEYAPALALPAEGADEALVPFERLWERFAKPEKWSNYGTNDVKAAQGMVAVVDAIAASERRIDRFVAEADRADVKALYFRTLDVDRAMDRAGELAEARERVAALEAERASWGTRQSPSVTVPDTATDVATDERRDVAAARPEPRPVVVETVVSPERYGQMYEEIHGEAAPVVAAPVPTPQPSKASTWLFYCRCNAQQAGELEAAARRLGISRLIARDGGTLKYKLVPVKEA